MELAIELHQKALTFFFRMASIDWPKAARNLSRNDEALFHPVMPGIASSGVSGGMKQLVFVIYIALGV